MMVAFDFSDYVEVEIERMKIFRETEEKRQGCSLTGNEAAILWVKSGRARQFRINYYKERGIDG